MINAHPEKLDDILDALKAAGLSLDDVFAEHFKNRKIPVISGLLFGHQPETYTIPIGVRAKLDADKKVLSLIEAAVLK